MSSLAPTPPASRARELSVWWAGLAIVGTVFLAYLPTLQAGFIWDDDAHVTTPALRSLHGLWRIWFEPGATQQYYPLLHSAFWLEHRLWGDTARAYHLVNLALHAMAAWMFMLVLRRLAIPGAWLAALLFALHPVHVESVAWISEQKNTLSAVLYLGAALAYLRFDETRRPAHYAIALTLFAAALLTKTVTATLPPALLVIFWWQRGRLAWRRDALPLVPWILLGAGAGLFTAWAERALIGAEGAAYDLSLLQRILLAGRVIWFDLGKLVWPADLTFIYPRWTIDAGTAIQWLPTVGALALGVGLWLKRDRSRAPIAVGLLFAGSLFPVLGFFNIYPFVYSFVADHFQYLASLAVIASVAGGLARFGPRGHAIGGVLALLLGIPTWRQAQIYHDNESLFRATLARNPACWMAHNNLGKELLQDKTRLPEAIASFERALALRPAYPEANSNLGLALAQSGRPREALPHLEAALRQKPDSFQILNNLGIALAGCGQAEEAVAAFRRAVRLNPNLPNLHENLGKALRLQGHADEAAAEAALAADLRAVRR